MDDDRGWLRTHWRTALALVLIFGIALFLRFYFVYGLAFPDGLVSGGSDSYYWQRAIEYSFETGKDLGWDPLLNYPVGLTNPRPPLFAWFALLGGRLFGPLVGDAWGAVVFAFLASTGLFGALTVFPTYLLGKEAIGRRAGLVAAFFLAVSAAHLQRSQATDADHDAFTLFFVVSTFYFYLRSLRSLKARRWVESWFSRASVVAGARAFLRENRTAALYALLAGLSVTAIALSWQGWAYVPVILLVYFVVQLFLGRVRNEDALGITALFAIVLATPLLLAAPWYVARGQVRTWFDVPGYLFLIAMVLGAVFTVTRDYPWTLVIPSTFLAGGIGLGVGALVNPTLANAFVSGAGYFIQTKVYETIAEAQAPGLSQLILSFGWFTFYLSLAGVAYMLWQIPRRHEPAYTMLVVWAFAAIFMAMAAARFIFNASPAFAVTAAFAIDQVYVRADFAGMRRTYRSLAEGSWRNALRKSVKLRHIVTVIVIGGLIVFPNVWTAVDAAIPYESKASYDRQIYEALPSFLRAPGYSGSGIFYFGAFGYSLPEDNEYFPAAWSWFETQDVDLSPERRPAFLSWWDYGFEAVNAGDHPTVADNFQDGFEFAGQFITAQGEDAGIALLAIRVLEGDLRNHRGALSAPARAVVESFGLPADEFVRAFTRPRDYVAVVKASPETYGTWDAVMQPANAMYIYLTEQLTSRFSTDRLADFYHEVRQATGLDIGYFAVDSRLFPISAQNTGIFYAPVKLSDHQVLELPDGRTLPIEFFQILVDTDRGQRPLQDVGPADEIRGQTIEYQPMFYESMFYRAYIGFSPEDLGLGSDEKGIPGFDENMREIPPIPAWNLSHFRVVYRTAYYNPFEDARNHTEAWRAVNYDEALRLQREVRAGNLTGIVDLSTQSTVSNGIVFLRYYDGAWVNGTVRAAGVTPVPGVRITVTDELGTPHYVTTTDAQGRYSALVPFGDITLTASAGSVNPQSLVGVTRLGTATLTVSVAQAMREDDDLDGDGVPDWILTRDLSIDGHPASGRAYLDLDRNGLRDETEPTVAGATVVLKHGALALERRALTDGTGSYDLGTLPDGAYSVSVELQGRTVLASDVAVGPDTAGSLDVAVPHGRVRGRALDGAGAGAAGVAITIRDETNGTAWQVSALADGTYEVPGVLQGNVTIEAEAAGVASLPSRVLVTPGDVWQNLTVRPAGRVVGTTRLFGTAQPFATVEFQAASGIQLVRSVTSDAAGSYAVTLPAGDWNVNGRLYKGTRLYATLGRVSVSAGGTASFSPSFVDGGRVNGTVVSYGGDDVGAQLQIAFLSDAGDWWVRTSRIGTYIAYLPLGAYGVQAIGPASSLRENLTVSGLHSFDLAMSAARPVSGIVYRDADGNGAPDDGEAIAGARLEVRDDRGRRGLAVTNDTGVFFFLAGTGRTYSGRVTARGFEDRPIAGADADGLAALSPIALDPVPVAVTGSILRDGLPLRNRPTEVRAVAVGEGARDATATADSNGGFGLLLIPGVYDLVVDENVSADRERRLQNLLPERITVPVAGSGMEQDIEVVERVRVTGRALAAGTPQVASITFTGSEVRAFTTLPEGYEVYLLPGTYAVYASADTPSQDYAFLDDLAIAAPGTLDLDLESAIAVSGSTLHAGEIVRRAMTITLFRAEGGFVEVQSAEVGLYSASLPPGTYDVAVTFATQETEDTTPRFVLYTFSGSFVLTPDLTALGFDLDLARTLDNTTVSGTVSWGGLGTDAAVVFYARGFGALEARATASASGAYAVGLAPGTYDVHATRSAGGAAFLGRLTVPHAAELGHDIRLVGAATLSGVVTDPQGARVRANVTVTSGERIELATDATGAFRVLLPLDAYALEAVRRGTEKGVDVSYRATAGVLLASDRVENLRLEKVVDRDVLITWDSSQKQSIPAGGSVTYLIEIQNTGNVADTFLLEGDHPGWTFQIAPSSVDLDFGSGASRATVTVTVESPRDARVNHGPVPVVARSLATGENVGSMRMEITILRYRGIGVQVNASTGTFDGRVLNYTVDLRNSGNDVEKVSVTVSNPSDLAALGWTARLAPQGQPASGTQLTGVVVPVNGTARVRLELTSAAGASGAPVVLEVLTEETPVLSATAIHAIRLPELQTPTGIGVSGPLIVRESTLVGPTLLAVGTAAAAAVGLGLFLTRKRR